MSLALDTIHADLVRELRADLAATRNAWQREREAKEALERERDRLQKAIRTIIAGCVAHRLNIENIAREVL